MAEPAMVISCEHGGNRIPGAYRYLFKDHQKLLQSHRGFDAGALALARRMATAFGVEPITATTSRLLVDLNRSPGHRQLFSFVTRPLDVQRKEDILSAHYWPHRHDLQQSVARHIDEGRTVVHIASHSFTPVLNGRKRTMDVGLLYDPGRESEKHFCKLWKDHILHKVPSPQAYSIRSNAPYKGISDGVPKLFRKMFPSRYIGIELEVNQRWYRDDPKGWKVLCDVVLAALKSTVIAFAYTV